MRVTGGQQVRWKAQQVRFLAFAATGAQMWEGRSFPKAFFLGRLARALSDCFVRPFPGLIAGSLDIQAKALWSENRQEYIGTLGSSRVWVRYSKEQ